MSRTRVKRIQKLVPTEEMGIANILEVKSAEVDERFKEGLPIISCECGAEILVVPDLQAMNRAIKTHVAEHRKKERNAKNNAGTSGKISQLLSQLTLTKMRNKTNTCFLDADKCTMSIRAHLLSKDTLNGRYAFMRSIIAYMLSNIKTAIQHRKREI